MEGTNKTLCAPGERSMTPQEMDPDVPVSVQESPAEVSVDGGLLQGRGTECRSVSPLSSFFHHSLASGQTSGREHSPKTENWSKDLQSMTLHIRTRPSFPHSQSLTSGRFHKPLIHQRADRRKTTITEN